MCTWLLRSTAAATRCCMLPLPMTPMSPWSTWRRAQPSEPADAGTNVQSTESASSGLRLLLDTVSQGPNTHTQGIYGT